MIPSVHTTGVKECFEPTTRTLVPERAARVTTSRTSSTVRARRYSCGRHDWVPAQLCHSATPALEEG